MSRVAFALLAFLLFLATGFFESYWLQLGGCSLFAFSILFLLAGSGRRPEPGQQPATKTGYMVRANERNKHYRPGYPVYVDSATVHRALETGEYTYDLRDTDARQIPEDIQYIDERLN